MRTFVNGLLIVLATFVAGCSIDASLLDAKLELSSSLTKLQTMSTTSVPADGASQYPLQLEVYTIKQEPVRGYLAQLKVQGAGIVSAYCEPTSNSGIANCHVSSSKPGEKLVYLSSDAINKAVPIVFYDSKSSVVVDNNQTAPANGQSGQDVQVVIVDENGNPVAGQIPNLDIKGTGNNSYTCLPSDANGVSHCNVTSDTPGDKVITVVDPKLKDPVTVTFDEPLLSADSKTANIDANGNNIAAVSDAAAKVVVKVKVVDSSGNILTGSTPTLSLAPSTGSDYQCGASNSSGLATCSVSSQITGAKILSISAPTASLETLIVYFVNGNSSVQPSPTPGVADNSTETPVTVTLKDDSNNPQIGITPSCHVIGGGQNSVRCTMSDVNGQSICYIKSDEAGSKDLFCDDPLLSAEDIVTIGNSNVVVGTDGAHANGSDSNSVVVTLIDGGGNIIVGGIPSFNVVPSGQVEYHCSASGSDGQSICHFTTDEPGSYVVSVTQPVGSQQDITLNFTSPYSDITVVHDTAVADATATTEITVKIMESQFVPKIGVTPVLDIQGAGQNVATCSASGITGESQCLITSTVAGYKVVKSVNPLINKSVSVNFTDSRSTLQEYVVGSLTAYAAAPTSPAKVLVTLLNYDGTPRTGYLPKSQVTGAGVFTQSCTVTDASGQSVCSILSDTAGSKVFTITDPQITAQLTLNFISTVQACTVDFGTGTHVWAGPGFSDFGTCQNIICNAGYTYVGGICKEFNPPTGESFTIASGAASVSTTSVVLAVTCPTDESGAVEMTAGFGANIDSGWVPCATLMNFTLNTGDGLQTVYMRFRDRFHNNTIAISDDIVLDQTPPVGGMCSIPNVVSNAVGDPNINLNITCPTDLNPPVMMSIANTANPNSGWVNCQSTYPHTLISGTGPKSVYLRFKDSLGQITTSDLVVNVNLDQTGPVSTLSYANAYQNVTAMSVSLTAVDDYSTVSSCSLGISEAILSSGALGSFSTFGPVAGTGNGCGSYVITGQSGKAYKFQGHAIDGFNNVGTNVTGTNIIKIDTTPPSGGSISNSNAIQTTAPIAITVNQGSDPESGMSATNGDYTIQVSSATFANPTCGSFSAFAGAGLAVTAAGTSYSYNGIPGNCYKFRYNTVNQSGLATSYDGASITKIDFTYAWITGGYGACDAVQPSWSTGAFGACSVGQPAWSVGAYGYCDETYACSYVGIKYRSVSCPVVGGTATRSVSCPTNYGNQYRTVQCQRSDSVIVADSYCVTAKPSTSTSCSRNDCAGGAPSSTTACTRGGGVDCAGGQPATSASCSDFTSACDGGSGSDGGD